MTEEVQQRDVPDAAKCPYCGKKPGEEEQIKHQLSKNGYHHDDIHIDCECGEKYVLGRPVGENNDIGQDLICGCGRYMRVHRIGSIRPDTDTEESRYMVTLHLKCPDCNYFTKTQRWSDNDSCVLIGYPDITGEIDDSTKPYGYVEGKKPGTH